MSLPTKPTGSPLWDTTGTNSSAPDGGHVSNGYALDEVPTSTVFNWMLNIFGSWISWISTFLSLTPGIGANVALTISAGAILPTQGNHKAGATGNVTDILQTNFGSGGLLLLKGSNSFAMVLENNIGVTCPLFTADGGNITLSSDEHFILFQLDSATTSWKEVSRSQNLSTAIGGRSFQARLTAETGVPIPTSAQSAVTTLYLTAYKGNQISLYDGTIWRTYSLGADLSLAVPNAASTLYDVFLKNVSGTLTLSAVAWTNDTTRATALASQNGIWVSSTDATSLYVGSFRTTTSAGQTVDSRAQRWIWNYYNRVKRDMSVLASDGVGASSWTYNSATIRQADSNTGFQFDFIVGIVEDAAEVDISTSMQSAAQNNNYVMGIGLNSTTTEFLDTFNGTYNPIFNIISLHYVGLPSLGRNYWTWLESTSGSILIFRGDMVGSVLA